MREKRWVLGTCRIEGPDRTWGFLEDYSRDFRVLLLQHPIFLHFPIVPTWLLPVDNIYWGFFLCREGNAKFFTCMVSTDTYSKLKIQYFKTKRPVDKNRTTLCNENYIQFITWIKTLLAAGNKNPYQTFKRGGKKKGSPVHVNKMPRVTPA